jgi:hypothetical protein
MMNSTPAEVFFWSYVAPELLAALVAGLGWGLLRLEKLLGVNVDATHNQALTNAVSTFAGLVLQDIKDGKVSMADVKDGHYTASLLSYLNVTVSGAMLHFNKPPADLNQMLVANVSTAAGMPVSSPLATAPATTASPVPSGNGGPEAISLADSTKQSTNKGP